MLPEPKTRVTQLMSWAPPSTEEKMMLKDVDEDTPSADLPKLMDYSDALRRMKDGGVFRRKGWNAANTFIFLARPINFFPDQEDIGKLQAMMATIIKHKQFVMSDIQPCFWMKTAQGFLQAGWVASQADQLATDWEEITLEMMQPEKRP